MAASAQISIAPVIKDDLTIPNGGTQSVSLATGLTLSRTLNSGSTPPVTMVVVAELTLSGGAYTLDFTSMTGLAGASRDASGLKLQYLEVINPAGNGNLYVVPGASNGYNIPNASSRWDLLGHSTLDAVMAAVFNDDLADVSGSAKTLDFSGTGTESFFVKLLFG